MQACVLIPEPSMDVDELELFHMTQGVPGQPSIILSFSLN